MTAADYLAYLWAVTRLCALLAAAHLLHHAGRRIYSRALVAHLIRSTRTREEIQ